MGNSSSSGRAHDETVDGGVLIPQGVYTGTRDWNEGIVTQLIIDRRLAPFYRPLEEYESSWDDSQILAARRTLPCDDTLSEPSTPTPARTSHGKRPSTVPKEVSPAAVYRGAIECPICFLYYPPNINYSRCCGQAICTECFVQIKRIEPTTTHVVSEPAACPYCVQDNFGIVYKSPPWRTGIASDGFPSPFSEYSKVPPQDPLSHKRRQKSYSVDSPEVVTSDHIRPDWEAKLASVKAAVARRANRRIIMRQVGDRLIPVGITSGRIHPLSPEEVAGVDSEDIGASRRSRRRHQNAPNGFEQYMGIAGQDLEEIMMGEAMRLSLLEHEEHQRKQAEEKRKKEAESQQSPDGSSSAVASSSGVVSSSLPASSVPIPSSSLSTQSTSFARSVGSLPPASSRDAPPSHTATSVKPYSTLTAALSAASTASAVLSGSRSAEYSASNMASNGTNTQPSTSPPPTETLTPSIMISDHPPVSPQLPSSLESTEDGTQPLLASDSSIPSSADPDLAAPSNSLQTP